MTGGGGPPPWPRLRDTWWVFGLALAALGLFLLSFVVGIHCLGTACARSLPAALLNPDAVGGLPRTFTSALFVAVAIQAVRGSRSTGGRPAVWWAGIGVIGSCLALVKLFSLDAGASPGLSLVGELVLAAPTLAVSWVTGHRWGVAGARPVVLAMAAYAAAAVGLDLVTHLAAALQDQVGSLTVVGATSVEELGEALAALLFLAIVRWRAPAPVRGR